MSVTHLSEAKVCAVFVALLFAAYALLKRQTEFDRLYLRRQQRRHTRPVRRVLQCPSPDVYAALNNLRATRELERGSFINS